MFWLLILSHLLADYPFQTDAVVQAKKHLPGLTFHVSIHLLAMLIVVFGIFEMPVQPAIFAILTVAILHFSIDWFKNFLSQRWATHVIETYLFDQVLHVSAILLVVYVQSTIQGVSAFIIEAPWVIYLSGLIVVSHVCFITERVIFYLHKPYQQWGNNQAWNRMMSRVGLFSLIFFGWTIWSIVVAVVALGFHWLDLTGPYRWRALLIDIGVSLMVIQLTLLILS